VAEPIRPAAPSAGPFAPLKEAFVSADPQLQPCVISVDHRDVAASVGENLLDALNRADIYIPHLCYNPALGPLKTCDTCFVGVNGALTRACTVTVRGGLEISTVDSLAEGHAAKAWIVSCKA